MMSISNIFMSIFFLVDVLLLFVLQFQSSSISISFGCSGVLLVLFLRSCNFVLFVTFFSVFLSFSISSVQNLLVVFVFLVPDSFFSGSFTRFIGSGWKLLHPAYEKKEWYQIPNSKIYYLYWFTFSISLVTITF